MFRNDLGWYMLENVEGLILFVLLRAWAQACIRSLNSCVHRSVPTYACLFLRLCICGNGTAYTGSCLCTWTFTSISTVSLLYAILTSLFVIFVSKHHYILLFIFILALKMLFFINSTWIKNLMSPFLFSFSFFFLFFFLFFFFFCIHHPFMLVGGALIRW